MNRRGATGLRKLAAVVGILVPVLACESPLSEAVGLVPLQPPPVYERFWAETESCSSLAGDLAEVRWFVARDVVVGSDILGRRTGDSEIILRADLWLDGPVVRHEMLHQLLRGDGAHENPAWNDCSGVVLAPRFIRGLGGG